MKSYMCVICGYVYNEEEGDPDSGIEVRREQMYAKLYHSEFSRVPGTNSVRATQDF